MNEETTLYLQYLITVTEFAKNHADNEPNELTTDKFIAAQFLRRAIKLAEDFTHLMKEDHELSAAMLQRAITERVKILGYLHEKDQFKQFQDYSLATEYLTLQHITSEANMPRQTKQAAQQRKKAIRLAMGGEPQKPETYWTKPRGKQAWGGNHNATPTHLISQEIPSSAVHPRHNDDEPTGIYPEIMTMQAALHMAAITLLSLVIANNESALIQFQPLIENLFPEDTEIKQ